MIPIMWNFPTKLWFRRRCLVVGGWDYDTHNLINTYIVIDGIKQQHTTGRQHQSAAPERWLAMAWRPWPHFSWVVQSSTFYWTSAAQIAHFDAHLSGWTLSGWTMWMYSFQWSIGPSSMAIRLAREIQDIHHSSGRFQEENHPQRESSTLGLV